MLTLRLLCVRRVLREKDEPFSRRLVISFERSRKTPDEPLERRLGALAVLRRAERADERADAAASTSGLTAPRLLAYSL
eukprot:3127555-Prymnesium_polylepis.1